MLTASTNKVKVFWFFFSKKNCFLYGLYPVSPDSLYDFNH